ncbi:putative Mg2+ transporter-C (MgtC) family protein [Enhydrobacter aerosaccus]|uniref:Protein MgtC n=1 Tax=Enhydrobacter aerosaccus TaxID=225324 RepID=A0A1T4RWY2_9HYPH|nr:MgtC/SapB family protein [Enhydrobacter aerosaccus]SKA20455.1 putative Mg2+ transporter-C (MgtC) family protein [Enhydrobacter aerosaccus]
MIEANLLLGVTGKTQSSFSMMDTLRFPLGILSGIGFIGAGVILKRGDMVMGVTTAATLWLITVIGLVLGAGYFVLGGAMVVVAFVVLVLLVRLEPLMERDHRAALTIDVAANGPSTDMLRATIREGGYKIKSLSLTQSQDRQLRCSVSWTSRDASDQVPAVVSRLLEQDGVLRVDWHPLETGQQHDD